MTAPEPTRPRLRTALSGRRTALVLLGVSLLGTKLTDLAGGLLATSLAVVGIGLAAVLVGVAEGGIRSLAVGEARVVYPLLVGTAAVAVTFGLVGVVLSLTP